MSDEMPNNIYAWEYKDNDYHNGTGFHENGWLTTPTPIVLEHKDGELTHYRRADLPKPVDVEGVRKDIPEIVMPSQSCNKVERRLAFEAAEVMLGHLIEKGIICNG
ncbi:MAG: hypothetical protein ACRBCK_09905 [Alphaproteobacteria bacterium]